MLYSMFDRFISNKIVYGLVLLLLIIVQAQTTVNAYITELFVDGVILKDEILVMKAFILGIFLFIIITLSKYLHKIFSKFLYEKVCKAMRQSLITNLKSVYLNEVTQLTQGELQHRYLKDVEETANIFFLRVYNLLIPFFTTIISFIYLMNIDLKIAVIVIGTTPILGVIFEKLRVKMRKISVLVRDQEAAYRNFHDSIINGFKIIVNNQKEKNLFKKDARKQVHLKKVNMMVAKLHGFGYGSALVIVYLIQISAIVIGFMEIQKGKISTGELVAITTLVGNVVAGFAGFGRHIAEMQQSFISAQKVQELLNLRMDSRELCTMVGEMDHVVVLKDIHFKYKDELILKGLNLNLKKGDTILLQGENGYGKSTILKIILGLYDPQGGRVISQSNQFSWLPTEDHIFSSSIKDNIFWRDRVDNDELSKYNELATDFMFDYELEDQINLTNLSGGEKQKIKLIRCLIHNGEVLLLDEPTKALDQRCCEILKNYIFEKLIDKTVVIIDHEGSFADVVDQVYDF